MAVKKTHSKYYETYATRHARGGCRKDQLHRAVEIGMIFDWEYTEITGEPYEEA